MKANANLRANLNVKHALSSIVLSNGHTLVKCWRILNLESPVSSLKRCVKWRPARASHRCAKFLSFEQYYNTSNSTPLSPIIPSLPPIDSLGLKSLLQMARLIPAFVQSLSNNNNKNLIPALNNPEMLENNPRKMLADKTQIPMEYVANEVPKINEITENGSQQTSYYIRPQQIKNSPTKIEGKNVGRPVQKLSEDQHPSGMWAGTFERTYRNQYRNPANRYRNDNFDEEFSSKLSSNPSNNFSDRIGIRKSSVDKSTIFNRPRVIQSSARFDGFDGERDNGNPMEDLNESSVKLNEFSTSVSPYIAPMPPANITVMTEPRNWDRKIKNETREKPRFRLMNDEERENSEKKSAANQRERFKPNASYFKRIHSRESLIRIDESSPKLWENNVGEALANESAPPKLLENVRLGMEVNDVGDENANLNGIYARNYQRENVARGAEFTRHPAAVQQLHFAARRTADDVGRESESGAITNHEKNSPNSNPNPKWSHFYGPMQTGTTTLGPNKPANYNAFEVVRSAIAAGELDANMLRDLLALANVPNVGELTRDMDLNALRRPGGFAALKQQFLQRLARRNELQNGATV